MVTYCTTAEMSHMSKEDCQQTRLMRAMRQVQEFKQYLASLGIKVSVRTTRVRYKEKQPHSESRNILAAIDEMTKTNERMTAQDIQLKIEEELGVSLSVSSIRRTRRLLGWKSPSSEMMAFSSDASLQRVLQRIESGEIWDDATEAPEQDAGPQPGRVIKVHICGVISQHCAYPKAIFRGILDKRRSQRSTIKKVAAERLGLDDDGFFEETDINHYLADSSALKHIKLVVIGVVKDDGVQSSNQFTPVSTQMYNVAFPHRV